MQGTIDPDLVLVALDFRRKQPSVPALQILDACFKPRTGHALDIGMALAPGSDFATLLREALDLQGAHFSDVVDQFAQRYGLEV